ncbi:MAG: EAL domain-containing protein [Candidatus Izemoplasmatales bacterium]|nr:EAL domain-containing protein [bacterium]MDZ4196462.1 EAL domain-containing protein [Candidatus Izemoplasmatales bacterium]
MKKKPKMDHYPHPTIDSLRIISIYIVLGGLWILLSDRFVDLFFEDIETIRRIQLFKGWFYVALTATIFYMIIHYRISQYKLTTDQVSMVNAQLTTSNEQLLQMEATLSNLAFVDALTKLGNRHQLEVKFTKFLEQHQSISSLAFIYFDIDNFKHINETLGHERGDALLIDVAEALKELIQEPDMVARLGGDGFAMVLTRVENEEQAQQTCDKLFSSLRKKWIVGTQEFFISISVGISMYPANGKTFTELLQNADTAMYFSKDSGRDKTCFYDPTMRARTESYLEMSSLLRKAIMNREFHLVYQPKYTLSTQEIIGYEALIRWNHPTRGYIAPLDFIPFAEQIGMIRPIEDYVFEEAFRQGKKWNIAKLHKKISINLSAITLLQEDFVQSIKVLLKQVDIAASCFEIEVTESALLGNIDKAISILEQLKDIGFTIALDDFGTGYSSLTYLQKLPIDVLKIDKTFIPVNEHELEKVQIIKSIIDLAHYLKLKVVAEGIESLEQVSILTNFGCDCAQGYFFSKPVLPNEIEKGLYRS